MKEDRGSEEASPLERRARRPVDPVERAALLEELATREPFMSGNALDGLAQHVTRSIFALKAPYPGVSTHYQSGWDDGLEAAMDAAREAVLMAKAFGVEVELYRHPRVTTRQAQVVARFRHPVTDAPMVTWYQTNPDMNEEPEFYSASEKEFRSWFRPVESP